MNVLITTLMQEKREGHDPSHSNGS